MRTIISEESDITAGHNQVVGHLVKLHEASEDPTLRASIMRTLTLIDIDSARIAARTSLANRLSSIEEEADDEGILDAAQKLRAHVLESGDEDFGFSLTDPQIGTMRTFELVRAEQARKQISEAARHAPSGKITAAFQLTIKWLESETKRLRGDEQDFTLLPAPRAAQGAGARPS